MAGKDGYDKIGLQVAVDSLLQFLRIKGGQGPNAFGLCVDPSLDVTDFYGAQSTVVTSSSVSAVAIGTGVAAAAAQLPRRMIAISGQAQIGAAAGTWLTLAIALTYPSGASNSTVYLGAQSFTPIAGGIYRVTASVHGMILPPGHQIALISNGNAGGADHNFSIEQAYQRLDGLP